MNFTPQFHKIINFFMSCDHGDIGWQIESVEEMTKSTACILLQHVILQLSNSVKIYFEYHTVFRAFKYWAI